MAGAKRRTSRQKASPSGASTTPTSNSTPAFSSRNSVVSETPMTTEVDEASEHEPPKTRNRARHAAAAQALDGVPGGGRVQKRKAASSVEMLVQNKRKRTTKGIRKSESSDEDGHSEEDLPRQTKGKGKNKGKARARAFSPVTSERAPSDGSLSDEESIYEESDDSGSAFIASDEEEEIMLDAAVRMSLQVSRLEDQNGASSSSAQGIEPSPEVARRAAATERRIARLYGVSDSDESFDDSSDDNVRRKGKAKGKAKSKPKIDVKTIRAAKGRELSPVSEHLERQALKMEEKTMSKKLGRKLTHAEKATVALNRYHPELRDVWGDISTIPITQPIMAPQPENMKLTLLPFQRESLTWMQKQEHGIWHGGILADEMGMGKTIQMISLIVSDGRKPNLVVAPTVAIIQWKHEVLSHTDGLQVLVWHGSSRETSHKELAKYDVVLTTYSVLESCFRKQESGFKRKGVIIKEKSPVHQVKWHRILLDEAHNIKERVTNTAKAAFELEGQYRWCLSGTPLQNRVGELYSLVRFLGGDPFSYYFCRRCDCKSLHWKFSNKATCDDCGHTPMHHTCFWNNEILTPIQKNGMSGPGEIAFKKLKILLDRMMLRRTKLQKADDLGLPPRTVIIRRDYFSPEEKELYLSLFSDAKRQFNTYLDQGTVLNNYSNIFSLLTRMRQMACHPDLVLRSKSSGTMFVQNDSETTICRICNDIAEDAIQSKCRHIFDRECIRQYLDSALENNPACPVCHLPLTIDLDSPALELTENAPIARQGILGRLDIDSWKSSTKIEALVEELSNLRSQDATTKSLVFSQFVNFLDLIAFRLQKAGFIICRLEGGMSPQARDATIQHFMNNVDVTVFLVSLKAGGVALNLTEASRVYLMDSWWNPAVEYQAMDRIHRLGQRRPVQAIKLVVEDSIESRIIQLQEKKAAMVDATLSADESVASTIRCTMCSPSPSQLGFLFRVSFSLLDLPSF
ncbi:SNF2 family N-terminal domain-containing protein [Amanita rubescens]|nr:SNF2 family N-terminal domain-containing protein [Amanita rubescens]